MSPLLKQKIAYRYHRHCAWIYRRQSFERSGAHHELQARQIDQDSLQGDVELPAWLDGAIYGVCRGALWCEYMRLLVSGRLDSAD